MLLHGLIIRTKENAREHGGQYLAFVKCKMNLSYRHPHYSCRCCGRSWEVPCGCKFLYLFSHCLHGKLSEGAETIRTGENRAAWIGKHYFGIFQAKIKRCKGSLASTQHVLCKHPLLVIWDWASFWKYKLSNWILSKVKLNSRQASLHPKIYPKTKREHFETVCTKKITLPQLWHFQDFSNSASALEEQRLLC